MFPIFKKKNSLIVKLLIFSNILLIFFGLIFFDLYKNRKINQYNKLFETKQNEIKEIENLFSKYYHSNEKFLFNKKKLQK